LEIFTLIFLLGKFFKNGLCFLSFYCLLWDFSFKFLCELCNLCLKFLTLKLSLLNLSL